MCEVVMRKRTVGDRLKPPQEQQEPPVELPIPFERPLGKPEVAAILKVTLSGLDKLVATDKAPPHFRVGRLMRWRPSVVTAWIIEQEKRAAESIKQK
jgi:predicted DNA-binding transcriptional regulator AlpA